ncbi:MAG TPA: helix-turn-helix domain-containing protein [Spirochaetia bacterium]|nr:helix-turn-helix domain-containing protein [Spirochaetia bacterium]
MDYNVHTPSQLATAVKSRRKIRKLTQQEVAGRVGLLPKTVSALENNPNTSSVDSLFKLLAALDLELVVRTKDEAAGSGGRGEW